MITNSAIQSRRDAIAETSRRMHEAMAGFIGLNTDVYKLRICELERDEIEQMIASLYPDEFPRYPDDWKTDDLCVGDHTHMSLLDKLINEVLELRKLRDTNDRQI